MNILSKTDPVETEKVLAEYSRTPPRPRRYRARSRYRFEEAYVPLQGKRSPSPCLACGRPWPLATTSTDTAGVTPSSIKALLDSGSNISISDAALVDKEAFLRDQLVKYMNEMACSHRMWSEVNVEHDKTLALMRQRNIKVRPSS
jgi:hypothetical protein